MDPIIVERYRKIRSEHPYMRVEQAFLWAKFALQREEELKTLPKAPEVDAPVTFERDGYDITFSVEYDQDYSPESDTDCYGWFYYAEGEDADKRPREFRDSRRRFGERKDKWVTSEVTFKYSHPRYSGYHWWVPPSPLKDWAYNGESKQVARENAIKRMRYIAQDLFDYYMDGWSCVVVVVTVRKNGIQLGSDALGGVEHRWKTWTHDFWDTVLEHTMIENAIEEAKRALSSLCECA